MRFILNRISKIPLLLINHSKSNHSKSSMIMKNGFFKEAMNGTKNELWRKGKGKRGKEQRVKEQRAKEQRAKEGRRPHHESRWAIHYPMITIDRSGLF